MIWPFWAPFQIYLNYMGPVANQLSEWDYTEILCFLFATQNNMISDIPVLFQ